MPAPLPRRLARLPRAEGPWPPPRNGDTVPSHAGEDLDVRLAATFAARLLGLAFLPDVPAHAGLLLPHTRAVHTFGMRFALDLVWLDRGRRAVRVDRAVAPRRVAACRRADAVLELRAG
jgi:uncharacterized membrane protein (UPF0127 family)